MTTTIQQLEDLKEWAQDSTRYERRLNFRSGQLVQPGPGRPGYKGIDTLLEAREKETNKLFKREINKKIGESPEFKKFFKAEVPISEITDPHIKSQKIKDKIRQLRGHRQRIAQLPDEGKGYVTLNELSKKLDIPKHVFESARNKALYAKLPGHNYKFIADLLNEQEVKMGKTTWYYFKEPKIRDIKKIKDFLNTKYMLPGTADAVNVLSKSRKLTNMLDKNEFPTMDMVKEILKKNKLPASQANASTAMYRLAQHYQGTKFKNELGIKSNKVMGNFIIRTLDAFDDYSDWGRGRYNAIASEVTKYMPDKAGDLLSFKNALRYGAKDLGMDFRKLDVSINEIFSIKGSLTNKAYPYAYFVDVMDSNLNSKALKNFHGNLSKTQIKLRNTIADLRAGKKGVVYDDVVKIVDTFNNQTRTKFANTIKKNYPGKRFDLAKIVAGSEDAILNKDFKIPSSVYTKKNLDKWAHLGVDVRGHAKTAGYAMTGADKPTVRVISEFFTPESRLKGKKVMVASTLDKFLKANGVNICG